MKFTLTWLYEHLDSQHNLAEICAALPMIGLEVEHVHDPLPSLKDFSIAKIISASPHPDADRLQICMVDIGTGTPLQIICGAPNARAGLYTILGKIGVYVPGSDFTIKKGTIRGQDSHGMLCSLSEVGLGDTGGDDGGDHGIFEIETGEGEVPLGSDFATYVQKTHPHWADPVIEIAITPNRGDCLGVRGIARDLAAAGYGTLKPLDFSPAQGEFPSPLTWHITDEAKPLVPLVSGRFFKDVTNGASPAWLAGRLRAVGQRPISALVDITNYVMLDLGRPLHAYDADQIKGDQLIIKRAEPGDNVLALNEKRYDLTNNMLAIGDAEGVDDIAGIMGGMRTGISAQTKTMFLEIAIFDPINIATTGRQLNLHSDARHRFERGLDQTAPLEMAGYIARLIQKICGGRYSHLTYEGTPPPPRRLNFSPAQIRKRTGIDCPLATQKQILQTLGFEIEDHQDIWTLTIPSWRNDIDGEADIVEEVMRIYGYDKLDTAPLPKLNIIAKPAFSPAQKRPLLLRRLLTIRQMTEAISFSFLKMDEARLFGGGSDALHIVNPISTDLAVMRPSALPHLLTATARNLKRVESIAFFEIGPIFLDPTPDGQPPAPPPAQLPEQRTAIAGVRHGFKRHAHWQEPARLFDLFDAKADLLACYAALGMRTDSLKISRDVPDWLHPGRSGRLCLGQKPIGLFGEIHPQISTHFDLPLGTVVFEFWLEDIPLPRQKTSAKPPLRLSSLQAVNRDFAFILDEAVDAQTLIDIVRHAARAHIDQITLFDLYQGAHIAPGKKSIALTVRLQPQQVSFSEADLTQISTQIIEAVAQKCGGQLRGN